MFFRLIEMFMLRKQVGLPEVLYQNVIVMPGGLVDFAVV